MTSGPDSNVLRVEVQTPAILPPFVAAASGGLSGPNFLVFLPRCWANCDGGTASPLLNVNDFVCFLSRFTAGDAYANCDASTLPPTLNVNDFACFASLFAAGCP